MDTAVIEQWCNLIEGDPEFRSAIKMPVSSAKKRFQSISEIVSRYETKIRFDIGQKIEKPEHLEVLMGSKTQMESSLSALGLDFSISAEIPQFLEAIEEEKHLFRHQWVGGCWVWMQVSGRLLSL